MMRASETERTPDQVQAGEDITSRLEHADARLRTLKMRAGQIQTRNLTRLTEEIELLHIEHDSIEQEVRHPRQTEATAGEAIQLGFREAVDTLLAKIERLFDELGDSDEDREQE
jgi:ribosome assembly protein YihI (activator of Der GTPase)